MKINTSAALVALLTTNQTVNATRKNKNLRRRRATIKSSSTTVAYSPVPPNFRAQFKNKLGKDSLIAHKNTSTDSDGRIVGGVVVNPPNKYSFQVAAMYGNSQVCGASLIAPDTVLCAAHCSPYVNQVQIGRFDLSDSSESYEVFSVVEEIKHPNYNDNTTDNDFMILKLSGSSSYTPVPLDNGSVNLSAGTDLTVIGWGTTSSGGSSSDELREVTVDYVTNASCNSSYGSNMITDNMMCAASPGKDSCQGDSGGPLVDATSGTQVGVVSWGYGCADPSYPGVYARVSSAYSWIQDNIDTSGPSPTPTPPSPPSPTPPAPSPGTCTDTSGWVDSFGDGCEWYENNDDPGCPTYGNDFDGGFGTPNEGCCYCGGGDGSGPSPTPPSPTPPAPSPGTCTDTPGWVDSFGDGCEWYENYDDPGCPTYGNDFDGGFGTPNEGCCYCGGGDGSGPSPTPPSTPSPTPTPPSPPAPTTPTAPIEDAIVLLNEVEDILTDYIG